MRRPIRHGARVRHAAGWLCSLVVPLVSAVAPAADLRVPEEYATIQAAIDVAGPDDVVLVAPGNYSESLVVSRYVTLVGLGDGPTDVTVQTNANSHPRTGDPAAALALHVLGDGALRAENLRFRNCFDEQPGETDRAQCCQVDGALHGRRLRLVGGSYTLGVSGFTDLIDSVIVGTADYVYGTGTFVCIGCILISRDVGSPNRPPAILAPRGHRSGGFVITASEFRGDGAAYLARSSKEAARVILLFNHIGEHVVPAGFSDNGRADPSPGWWYWECGNTGPGADRSGRVPWAVGCEEP